MNTAKGDFPVAFFLMGGFRRWCALTLACCLMAVLPSGSMAQSGGAADAWGKLREDGVHDPRSPGIKDLQEPGAALSELARHVPDSTVGNQVRWVSAIEKGVINPRAALWESTQIRVLDLDIYLDVGGSMPVVRFPHKAHTYWLDCSNCHEHVFASKAGASKIAMYQILEGQQCGICHGAVAFPLTECKRCHSVSQADFNKMEHDLGLVRVPGSKVAVPPTADSAKRLRGR